MKKYLKSKKAISLIVLVIAIIVIVILAGSVILVLTKNNPLENAKKAKFMSSVDSFQNELTTYETTMTTNTLGEFDYRLLNADETSVTYTGSGNINTEDLTIKDIITSIGGTEYVSKFEILNGELAYINNDANEKKWCTLMNVVLNNDITNVSLLTTDINPVKSGTTITYIIDVTSKVGIKDTYNLTDKVILLNDTETELVVQPNITYGTVENLTNEKRIPVYINTTGMQDGSYKVKLLADVFENNVEIKNVEIISTNLFTIDSTAPSLPTFSVSPIGYTNQNVTVTIAYPNDSILNEYSLDGTTWANYIEGTTSIVISSSPKTVYARATDNVGNQTSNSTITINSIDKTLPVITLATNGGTSSTSISTSVTVTDSGGSGLSTSSLQYVWDTQNTTTPTSGWNSFTNGGTLSYNGQNNAYYLWTKAKDNAGNENISISLPFYLSVANAPVLATGMTAVKWNSTTSTWDTVLNPDTDNSWYDYTNKIWANAKTADGSMWVWIPRYKYYIPDTIYHKTGVSSSSIRINIIFESGTNITTNTTDHGISSTAFITHPAFTFGGTELEGIWVAKFEASGTSTDVNILPGAISLRSITIGNAFTACKNMESNSRYGFGTADANGNVVGLDAHLIKNYDWSAVMYLSRSTYGKNSALVRNTDSSYYTGGGSGTSYITKITQSTTGNIYGIYDMSGGAFEYSADYYNTTASYLTNGSNIVSADSKYKSIYSSYSNTIYGDSVYAIDNSPSSIGGAWDGSYSLMPTAQRPFFIRGSSYNSIVPGAFGFDNSTGVAAADVSFRPVIAVADGL